MKYLHSFKKPSIITIFACITCSLFIIIATGCDDIERVSVDSQGQQVFGGHSLSASISENGRFVAFRSHSGGLVSDDNNSVGDVFVSDRLTKIIERVNVSSDGDEANGHSLYHQPAISADGRFVAFWSRATNLVPNDNNGVDDLFVRDRQGAGTTERVSVSSNGEEANDDSSFSYEPAISADGRFVAFASFATNLVPNDNNNSLDIFIRDRQGAGTTERVSISSNGEEANLSSCEVAISADGRFVAFESDATNLVPNDDNQKRDIFIRDRQGSGITERVSVSSNGEEANDVSADPAISADGRFVAFYSLATNLVPNDNNQTWDVFIYDRLTGIIERVSVSSNGDEANDFSSEPAISADGRFVVFASNATNLVPNDYNQKRDIFIRDRQGFGVTQRVSVSSSGDEANNYSVEPAISTDGRFVTFHSWAGNIVPDDTNRSYDVFAAANPFFPYIVRSN